MNKKINKTELIDLKRLKKLLKGTKTEVLLIDCTDSTNDFIKREADREGGLAVIAARQSGGKGRLGRAFSSPEGTGLYLSVLLESKLAKNPLVVTPAAAVVTARAIEECFGLNTGIKWVNDLYFNDKKICGILTERVGTGGYIVGIGINIYKSDALEGLAQAGSLFESGEKKDVTALAAHIISGLLSFDYNASFVDDYRLRCITVGKNIVVSKKEGEEREAKAVSIGDDFSLTVEYADGERENLAAGEVSLHKKFVGHE